MHKVTPIGCSGRFLPRVPHRWLTPKLYALGRFAAGFIRFGVVARSWLGSGDFGIADRRAFPRRVQPRSNAKRPFLHDGGTP
jgi:hypothetical protein